MLDVYVLTAAGIAFISMLLVQAITFRALDESRVFPALIQSVISGVIVDTAFCLWLVLHASWHGVEALLLFVCSDAVYLMLTFVYVLCVFGPYTTSVRIRLLREIGSSKEGLTNAELFQRYNDDKILDIRLKRLIGSGYVSFSDGKYILRRKDNVFHLMDIIADILKKIVYGRTVSR